MKIIYTYNTSFSDGSGIHSASFIKAYRALGGQIVENGKNKQPCNHLKNRRSLVELIQVRAKWLWGNLQDLFNLIMLAQSANPDALLFRFSPIHEYFLAIITLSFFYPVILEVNAVRSIENDLGRPWVSDFLDYVVLSRARKIFVVSNRLKQHLIEVSSLNGSKICVIENGVDADEFSPTVSGAAVRKALEIEESFVVGFIGSFKPWHGIDYLIKAAESVISELPEVVFLLIGDGLERAKCEDLLQKKGISKNFIFTGYIPHSQVVPYLAAMDVVMAPHSAVSFSKGFYGSPVKIFEYMAMGKPVIAAPLEQIKEVIQDGISGLLVSSEETEKVKRALLQLYRDNKQRERIGSNARGRVLERYTWKANAEKVKKLIQEAIADELNSKIERVFSVVICTYFLSGFQS